MKVPTSQPPLFFSRLYALHDHSSLPVSPKKKHYRSDQRFPRRLALALAALLLVLYFTLGQRVSGPPACKEVRFGRSFCPADPRTERWSPTGCADTRVVGSIQGWTHISTQLEQEACFRRCATYSFSAFRQLDNSCYCSNEPKSSGGSVCKQSYFSIYYHPAVSTFVPRRLRGLTRALSVPGGFAWGGEDI